ncbi:MAG: PIN domain-containing protein [Candidatus Verstraetearchaeota archaeon]|nr:PIN domain-containing protein [Candidatus Verstraetearchaeota archaeon]
MDHVARAVEAVRMIAEKFKVKEVCTLGFDLIAKQMELERRGLSFFDSFVAASALAVDGVVISDDDDFDRVHGLRRIALSEL